MITDIIHRETLHHGGFAGLREHRLVNDLELFKEHKDPATSDGLGALLYLADARFNPYGETHMHPHKEVDVVTVMVEGKIVHEGSLQHGENLSAGDVQVQRAGGEGFSHNEINPDSTKNRLLQLWFRPEVAGAKADYRLYKASAQPIRRLYGGEGKETFNSSTVMDLVTLKQNERFVHDRCFEAYLFEGDLESDGYRLTDGDLFRGEGMTVVARTKSRFILIYQEV